MGQRPHLRLDRGDQRAVAQQVTRADEVRGQVAVLVQGRDVLAQGLARRGGAAAGAHLLVELKVIPEVMIPLVGNVKELANQKKIVVETAEKVFEKAGTKVNYMVGTMIEVPRGALTADQVAEQAEFFSFGTNDLTQTTFGFSRDDSGVFIKDYQEKQIFDEDPFAVLDREGVGALIKIALEKGRQTRPDLEVGICGEHGGDPKSVEFCVHAGIDYVSASPYRVPIAKLAAAQAAIAQGKEERMRTA